MDTTQWMSWCSMARNLLLKPLLRISRQNFFAWKETVPARAHQGIHGRRWGSSPSPCDFGPIMVSIPIWSVPNLDAAQAACHRSVSSHHQCTQLVLWEWLLLTPHGRRDCSAHWTEVKDNGDWRKISSARRFPAGLTGGPCISTERPRCPHHMHCLFI